MLIYKEKREALLEASRFIYTGYSTKGPNCGRLSFKIVRVLYHNSLRGVWETTRFPAGEPASLLGRFHSLWGLAWLLLPLESRSFPTTPFEEWEKRTPCFR